MRIAFILGGMTRDGLERVVSILSNDYIEKGWSVDIIMLLNGKVEYDLSKEIRFVNLSNETKSRIRMLPQWLKQIRMYVKENHPDIILSFAARINIISAIALIGKKENLFVSERNDPRYDSRGKLGDWLTKIIYPHVKAVIFQTHREQEYFRKLKNGVIIPNPINVETYAVPEKKKRIVTAGRFDSQKNQKLLIQSFANIYSDFPEYSLDIYGRGKAEKELRLEAKKYGVDKYVNFKGNIPDIHEKIKDAEIFVLPSNYEGLSNILLEAMVMGLPVISTNVSGADEYIEDGVNGLLVPVGDEKALTRALRRMLSDEVLRNRCGRNAKKIVCKVSKEVVLKKWHEVLEQ